MNTLIHLIYCRLFAFLRQIQDALRRMYTCVQLNTVDSLPIEFELPDQDSIKAKHEDEKKKLFQVG